MLGGEGFEPPDLAVVLSDFPACQTLERMINPNRSLRMHPQGTQVCWRSTIELTALTSLVIPTQAPRRIGCRRG
jgi:hypothetical protein